MLDSTIGFNTVEYTIIKYMYYNDICIFKYIYTYIYIYDNIQMFFDSNSI